MKKYFFVVLTVLLIIPSALIFAQSPDKNQSYWVHEDRVKLSMISEYEAINKELVDNLKKHNIQDEAWLAANTRDGRYLFLGQLKNMADLDRQFFSSLSEKMGQDAVSDLFNRMDKCYNKHLNYVITLDNELSYMPNGMTQTPEGEDFRKFMYLHYSPANSSVIKEKMKAVKDLFSSKGSKMHYRVYKSGFGTPGDFYMVAVAAKDAVDYANKAAANEKLIGEEGAKVRISLISNLSKYEEVLGQMRHDLAYIPKKSM